jgi:hypothetical protein
MRRLPEALGDGTTGLIVCDIDDTLIRADGSEIGIWKKTPDGEIRLTTSEFASDPDKGDPNTKYDYREFSDPEKVKNSIMRGTPLINNLAIVDEKVEEGYDFAFLTARSAEDVIKDVLRDFMKINRRGMMEPIGEAFKEGLSYAVNDEKYCEILDGMRDFERKAYFLEKLCDQYDHVIFVDDDKRNLDAASDLNLPNLQVIRAH